ncbi:MAG: DUF502 domain-containing protein [Bacteroidota bacterium]|nr:MAG: DUF502 domain-containing protein [Bacteroidota bacterium]
MTFSTKLKDFAITTLIGGLIAILPLTLLVLVFKWVIGIVIGFLRPIVSLIPTRTDWQEALVYVLTIVAITGTFFLAGLIIRTRIGRIFNRILEDKYLMKIPGYKVVRGTILQIFSKNSSFFSEVVLVDPFNTGTLMTGFITDKHGEYITVFVPTGPNPTSGNIFHVKREKVIFTSTPADVGIKSIIGCGAGSNEVFKSIVQK